MLSEKKLDYIHVKVSKSEKKKIKEKAEELSLTVSSYVRMLALGKLK